MPGSPHPIDVLLVDDVEPGKSAWRADERIGHRRTVENEQEVRDTDFTGQFAGLYIRSLSANFTLDTGDLQADDGADVIHDAAGNHFVRDTTATAEYINVKDAPFNAQGDDATNDTAAINAAFAAAYADQKNVFFPAGIYRVDVASPGGTYALLNRGVSFFGAGHNRSVIAPLASMANTVSFIIIWPNTGFDIDDFIISNILIHPSIDGPKRGKHAIWFLIDGVTNVSRFKMDGVYCAPGNDYSLKIENNLTLNPQGCPSNSLIERCAFWEGAYVTEIGDSVVFRGNILRSSASSGRVGLRVYMADSLGVAGHLIFQNNNVDCDGGAISVEQGREVKILYNNIELSAGAGTNGAVIDIDGSSGTVNNVEIRGNQLGIFGTATATKAIRLNNSDNSIVDGNVLGTPLTVADGISIGASCDGTVLGTNTITGFTNSITDGGTNTKYIVTTQAAASQAEMESNSALGVFVSPGRIKFAPGVAKFWGRVTVAAGVPTLVASENVASITDTATGRLTVTINTDMSSANYKSNVSVERVVTTQGDVNKRLVSIRPGSQAAGSIEYWCTDGQASEVDVDPAAWHFDGHGDQ